MGNSVCRSGRAAQPPGTPTGTPSMKTLTMPPLVGSARRLPGDSTQPKLLTDPLTVSPCPGVSIAPNGVVATLLVHVLVREPSRVECPSTSSAYALNVNVPLPWFGRKLVSNR